MASDQDSTTDFLNESIQNFINEVDEEPILIDERMIVDDNGQQEQAGEPEQEQAEEPEQEQVSNSQPQSQSKSRAHKLPILDESFSRIRPDDRKIFAKCLHCQALCKTMEISRMVSHVKRCHRIDEELRASTIQQYTTLIQSNAAQKVLLNDLWAEVMVENYISFSCLDSGSWKKFIAAASPNWNYAQRQQVSEFIIPKLSSNISTDYMTKLSKYDTRTLTVEYDHWKDPMGRSLLGVVLTDKDDTRYLCNLHDASIEGHSGDMIVEGVDTSLKGVPIHHINAFISDSACESSRKLLVALPKYQHVIQHRCLAHLLNNMGKRIAMNTCVREALDWAKTLTTYISRSSYMMAKLKEAEVRRPTRATSIRWYSTISMIETLIVAKSELINECEKFPNLDMILDEDKWLTLERITEILRPLADCIAVAERRDGNLSELMHHVLEFGKVQFAGDWCDPFVLLTVKAYLLYFGPSKLQDDFTLLLSAYATDLRYKLDYLTEDGIDLALKGIMLIAVKTGCSQHAIAHSLIPEFNDLVQQKGRYTIRVNMESPAKWWASNNDGGALQQVALRLAHLKSSSANIERTFSNLKCVVGLRRTNLSVETLTHSGRIRIAQLNSSLLDSRDDDSRESALEESFSSTASEESQESECSSASQSFASQTGSCASMASLDKLDLLDTVSLRKYREFVKLIDFSLLKPIRASNISTSEPIDFDQLIKEARLRRVAYEDLLEHTA